MNDPMRSIFRAGWLAALCAAMPVRADEGMWTYDHVPTAAVQAKYGVALTPAWLDHLRLASLRMAGGCSASFVSPAGLVMTNHHCVRGCLQDLSGLRHRDIVGEGFYAQKLEDEVACPGMEFDQLLSIDDVSGRVRAATRGVETERFEAAQRAAFAAIEARCATSDELRCEVVPLFRGGRYDLYTYRRLRHARLVFAPEQDIADFGGDPDNFNFPRYDLDVAFLRVYGSDGVPITTANYLAWSDGRIAVGEPTFVSGNPGGTSREWTVAQLEDARDRRLPRTMMRLGEARGFLTEYQTHGEDAKRFSTERLFGTENALKSIVGKQAALADPAFYGTLVANEAALRARVAADPALAAAYGDTWDRIAELVRREQRYRIRYDALERGPWSALYGIGRDLVRHAEEVPKPNDARLREFSDARLPRWRESLLAERPISRAYDIATLTWSLTKLREDLGPDDPLVRRVFGTRSPAQVAREAVEGSRLDELRIGANGEAVGGLRKELLDGGQAAIDAFTDLMIVLVRALDPAARAIRRTLETEVDGPLRQQQERLAQARLALDGDRRYPDATFTLRLSYGVVSGWLENGREVPAFTTLGGVFERATGVEPFALPASWLKARDRLDPALPFDFVTTNDIIGGNSGSPMVDRHGAVIGLVFDGNIHSLGGDYGFDPALNRTVAVHSAALLEALDRVYGAGRLVDEIRPAGSTARLDRMQR